MRVMRRRHVRLRHHVIKAASMNDPEALSIVLRYFDKYINRLATCYSEEFGNSHGFINGELKLRLQNTLLLGTLAFCADRIVRSRKKAKPSAKVKTKIADTE